MAVVGIILGLAVIVGMFAIAAVAMFVATRSAPLPHKLALVAISTTAIIGVLCTLHFLASFVPSALVGCFGMADCQSSHAAEELVAARWSAFFGAVGMFAVSLGIMRLFGRRRSTADSAVDGTPQS